MRAVALIASLFLAGGASGCGMLVSGGDQAGPPDWFLREHERAQAAALRAAAAPGAPLLLQVATPHAPEALGERAADQIETCWVGGEPGWRVTRAAHGREVALVETADAGAGEPKTALSLVFVKGSGPGLAVEARGPLAKPAHRDRIRRALERAKSAAPGAPNCPALAAG